ncbi:MAG: histidine kinase [Lachnospiraceae bacterium]|nr:histidine kinase [Lachnospiraceae bacterium]
MSYYILFFSIYIGAFLLSVVGLWFSVIVTGIDRFSKRFFLSFFLDFMLCCLSSIVAMAFKYYAVPKAAYYFMLLMATLLLFLPLPMMTAYLLHCCGENLRSSRIFHAALDLLAVYFALLVSVPFIDGFGYVSPENQFYRGPLYPLLQVPVIAVLLLNFAVTMRHRARFPQKTFLSFVIAQVPMAIMLIVNLFVDAVALFDLSYVLSVLAMYSLILSDQIEHDLRCQREIALKEREIAEQHRKIAEQQCEIANQRANNMILQMRPHFIYNALMSIYSLCKLDPLKARQVTMDFTNYLRKNFSAIASDNPIPFSEELEHTRAYLVVEQALHYDMLVVYWDTPFSNFRLPPLTVEPIVENSIKHGMDLDADPLYISIRTWDTDSGTHIIVEDNGSGFDPSGEDKPHTTLENIRQRLEMMCSGSMTIKPREGGGTVVTVTIPDSTEQKTPRNLTF